MFLNNSVRRYSLQLNRKRKIPQIPKVLQKRLFKDLVKHRGRKLVFGDDDFANAFDNWGSFYSQIRKAVPHHFISVKDDKFRMPETLLGNTPIEYKVKPHEAATGQYLKSRKFVRGIKFEKPSTGKENITLDATWKRANPFRQKPHLHQKLSYKNPKLMYPFLTENGQIQSRRYTGLKARSQKKMSKEIKKMRHMGLISLTSNPLFMTDSVQPMVSELNRYSNNQLKLLTQNLYLRQKELEMSRLQEPVLSESVYWSKEQDLQTKNTERQQLEGTSDKQIERKREELKRLLLENIVLKRIEQFRKIGTVQRKRPDVI